MAIRVTLSANAGVSVELGGVRIWIDALHDTRVPGFSTLDSHLPVSYTHLTLPTNREV